MGVMMESEKRPPQALLHPSTSPRCPSVFLWCVSVAPDLVVHQLARNAKRKSDP